MMWALTWALAWALAWTMVWTMVAQTLAEPLIFPVHPPTDALVGAAYFDPQDLVDVDSMHSLNRRATIQHFEALHVAQASGFMVEMSIGTPGQRFNLTVDTLSGDLWVYGTSLDSQCIQVNLGSDSDPGRMNRRDSYGTCVTWKDTRVFDGNRSSSFRLSQANPEFSSMRLLTNQNTGVYGIDILDVGPTSMNQTFGIANYSNTDYVDGALGLGYAQAEGVDAGSPLYTPVLAQLRARGLIFSQSYSLWVHPESDSGSLLLGAIDTSQYEGTLYVAPMAAIPDSLQSEYRYVFATLSSISVSNHATGASGPISSPATANLPVLLDSGNSFTFLPYAVIVQIASQLNALYAPDLGTWVQSCHFRTIDGSINLHFGPVQIQVPISDILVEIFDSQTGQPFMFNSGEPVCILNVMDAASIGVNSIGYPVLKAMYTYVDLENNMVGIAPVRNLSDTPALSPNVVLIANNLTNSVANVTVDSHPSVVVNGSLAPPQTTHPGVGNGFPQLQISSNFFLQSGVDLPTIADPNATPTTRLSPEAGSVTTNTVVAVGAPPALPVTWLGLLMGLIASLV